MTNQSQCEFCRGDAYQGFNERVHSFEHLSYSNNGTKERFAGVACDFCIEFVMNDDNVHDIRIGAQ